MNRNLNHIDRLVMQDIIGSKKLIRDDIFGEVICANGFEAEEPVHHCITHSNGRLRYKQLLMEYLVAENLTNTHRVTHRDFWEYRLNLYAEGNIDVKSSTSIEKTKDKRLFFADTSLNSFINNLPYDSLKSKVYAVLQEELKANADNVYEYLEYDSTNIFALKDIEKEIFTRRELLALLNTKVDGMGRGEVLINFLFKDSTINGYTERFDLLLSDGQRNEIKFPVSGCSFRLGTTASAGNSQFFNVIKDAINVLNNLILTIGEGSFRDIVSMEFAELSKQFLELLPDINSGELCYSKINLIYLWMTMAHVETDGFFDNDAGLVQDVFTKEFRCSYGFVNDTREIINVLRSIKYVDKPLLFKSDIRSDIKRSFDHIDNLIVFDEKLKEIRIYQSSDDLILESISQNNLKVIERKFNKNNKTFIEDAFLMWCENKDLNFYSLYTRLKNNLLIDC